MISDQAKNRAGQALLPRVMLDQEVSLASGCPSTTSRRGRLKVFLVHPAEWLRVGRNVKVDGIVARQISEWLSNQTFPFGEPSR